MAHTKTTWGGAVSMSLFYDLVWDIQTERYSNLQSLAYCSHDSHSGTANHSPNLSIPSSTSVVLISSGIYLWTLKLFYKHPKQNAASSFGNSNKTQYWKLARTLTRLDIHKLWVNRPSLGSLHRVRFRNLTAEKHLEDSYTKEKLKTDDDIVNPQDELYSMAREVGSNPSVSDQPKTNRDPVKIDLKESRDPRDVDQTFCWMHKNASDSLADLKKSDAHSNQYYVNVQRSETQISTDTSFENDDTSNSCPDWALRNHTVSTASTETIILPTKLKKPSHKKINHVAVSTTYDLSLIQISETRTDIRQMPNTQIKQ